MTATIKSQKGRVIEFGQQKIPLEYKEGESYKVAKVEEGVAWLIHPDNPAMSHPFVIVEDVILEGDEQ